MKLKVTYSDGQAVEINAGPRAQVALERNYGITLAEGRAMEHLYYLAWAALHFAGQEPKDFDEFLGRIDDVDPVEESEPDPTPRARRRTASSA